jgi:hypothetical protein
LSKGRADSAVARHRGGPFSALDQIAASQLFDALAHPLRPQQVAVVKEGVKP